MTHPTPNPASTRGQAKRLAALDRVPREVFELLAAAKAPLKAYDLLWRLQEKRGRRAPPSTIYRAVGILIEAGLVHRLESVGAFVVCASPGAPHDPIFLVCEQCGSAVESNSPELTKRVTGRVKRAGFQVKHLNFVVRGICAACASANKEQG